MRQFIDMTGKTQEEAVSRALEQLNLERDDVSVEVLERAKSGFLGIGATPAKVRVYYGEELPEEAPVKSAACEKPAPAAKEEKAAKEERPVKEEKAAKPEKKAEKPRQQRKEAPEQKKAAAPAAAVVEAPAAPAAEAVAEEEVHDEKAEAIRTFLTGLLAQMDSNAQIRVYQPERGRYRVVLSGEKMGALIGRRGETLDAIQQLTSYAVSRNGGRVRVQLDAENYREKREQSLEHLARKVAGKVIKYRRSVTLEPMNAYERHVIHTALQDYEGVTTYSTGTEPNRRVIVALDKR